MNISKVFLKVFNLPGAVVALLIYSCGLLVFRKQIVGQKDIQFKDKLTASIVPVSFLSWIGFITFLILTR